MGDLSGGHGAIDNDDDDDDDDEEEGILISDN